MGDRTLIEWADASWNPVRAMRLTGQLVEQLKHSVGWHCEHVSEACRNCYAEGMNKRLGTGFDYKPGHLGRDVGIFLDEKLLLQPLAWRRPRKIFVCSMTDLFADFVSDEMIDRMFAVMALCPQHVFQVLTKRPKRMREYITALLNKQRSIYRNAGEGGIGWQTNDIMCAFTGEADEDAALGKPWRPLPNVWLGVSVEDQTRAEERILPLLKTPAAVHWLSCEPLLGPLDLTCIDISGDAEMDCLNPRIWADEIDDWRGTSDTWEEDFEDWFGLPPDRCSPGAAIHATIDWVVVGGESGLKARPMHPDWARSLRDQCAAAGVPFHFKQVGEWHWSETDDHPVWDRPHCFEHDMHFYRLGKKAAGRLLDGVEHDGFPA